VPARSFLAGLLRASGHWTDGAVVSALSLRCLLKASELKAESKPKAKSRATADSRQPTANSRQPRSREAEKPRSREAEKPRSREAEKPKSKPMADGRWPMADSRWPSEN